MLGGSLLLFLLLFYFFPSPPIRSGEAFSSVICFLDVAMVWKGKPASVTTGSRDLGLMCGNNNNNNNFYIYRAYLYVYVYISYTVQVK